MKRREKEWRGRYEKGTGEERERGRENIQENKRGRRGDDTKRSGSIENEEEKEKRTRCEEE